MESTGTVLLFLGGTVGQNKWRDSTIEILEQAGIPKSRIFNPAVDDWTPEHQAVEDRAKSEAAFCLYEIADPRTSDSEVSTYSMIEAVMALYDAPAKTVVSFNSDGLQGHSLKVLKKVYQDVKRRFPNAPIFCDEPKETMDYLIQALKQAL